MLKDLNKLNYIIPPSDPRYGKLGHLWKKYNYENLIYSEGNHRTYFYVPPELVIREYMLNTVVLKSPGPISGWDNWVYKRDISRLLINCCNLTIQEYFDLLILQINNITDRPKCPICKAPIYFYSIYYGYGSPYTSWINKKSLTCSHHCSDLLRWADEYDWFNSADGRLFYAENLSKMWKDGLMDKNHFDVSSLWSDPLWRDRGIRRLRQMHMDYKFKISFDRGRFLSQGSKEDTCYLYVTWTDSYLKFGVTSDPECRMITSTLHELESYKLPHVVYSSTRTRVANLEARIKEFTKGREYLNKDELHLFISALRTSLETNLDIY